MPVTCSTGLTWILPTGCLSCYVHVRQICFINVLKASPSNIKQRGQVANATRLFFSLAQVSPFEFEEFVRGRLQLSHWDVMPADLKDLADFDWYGILMIFFNDMYDMYVLSTGKLIYLIYIYIYIIYDMYVTSTKLTSIWAANAANGL